ncbi:olfactory receptor 2D3-like [Heterocephalus glaber]|uniref:Olfactory receptor n=1 Tax=Heterocephalus glaber TaxID=10181 RepID=A0AAX6PYM6_HETGA|nr:olfactory receptor 2D3-like [Heterocephalus glaber]
MGKENQTNLTEFILLGLSSDDQTQILLFVIFLIIYLLTVSGNLLIILLIHIDSRLHTPMYFFLKNLSFSDLCFSTTIVPKMLLHFLVMRKTISFAGCSIQMFFFLIMGCTESSLLAVMSYDRYVAVCKPLHYSTIMTQRVCVLLAIGSWASGVFVSLVDTTFTLCLPYQGSNVINHYFCEPPALLKLASKETYKAEMAIFAMGVVILLGPVSLILFSYWNIICAVIQIQSGDGRLKVFSTCGSHFIVVIFFYGSTIFTYMQPNTKKMDKGNKVISVFYSVITSMMNPFIYSLRNKDVKEAFRKVLRR